MPSTPTPLRDRLPDLRRVAGGDRCDVTMSARPSREPGGGLAPVSDEVVERQQLLLEGLGDGRDAAVAAAVTVAFGDPEPVGAWRRYGDGNFELDVAAS